MLRRGGGASSAARYVPGRPGDAQGSPTSAPPVISSIAALSRTDQVTACGVDMPAIASTATGPTGLTSRDGLKPNRPQWLAGSRVEPAPSELFATGTIPLATAAVEPPDEPPGVRVVSQGLRVGPKASGSVVKLSANSGVLLLPRITMPAAL